MLWHRESDIEGVKYGIAGDARSSVVSAVMTAMIMFFMMTSSVRDFLVFLQLRPPYLLSAGFHRRPRGLIDSQLPFRPYRLHPLVISFSSTTQDECFVKRLTCSCSDAAEESDLSEGEGHEGVRSEGMEALLARMLRATTAFSE